jgi:hypothetical protein
MAHEPWHFKNEVEATIHVKDRLFREYVLEFDQILVEGLT